MVVALKCFFNFDFLSFNTKTMENNFKYVYWLLEETYSD